MPLTHTPAELEREALSQQLSELIAALDARVPHLARIGETRIANDDRALRAKASRQIADLGGKR